MHCRSIAQNAKTTVEQLVEASKTTPIALSHEKELKLAKCITKFPEILLRVMDDLYPHVLCDYIYELCTTFTEFYNVCYCVQKDRETGEILNIDMNRLMICEVTARVLEKGLFILGLDVVDKM